MENRKTIIASIIGVALLVLTVVGATFAYFTTVTTNDEGVTNVTGKTDAIGSVALTNPTSNLHITLSALDMSKDNSGFYYATDDVTKNYDSEVVQRDIAVATLTGGETTTYYECTTTINVSVSGTMLEGLKYGDAYIQFGGLLININQVDLKNISSAGYPVTFKLNGTNSLTQSVSAAIAIKNRNANQNSIAGKELTLTFSNDDLDCKVVRTPSTEGDAFAIYSETDNSLRFYKNYDDVSVGDTYNDLAVTAVYSGFEDNEYASHTEVPWNNYRDSITSVYFEDIISPISTAYWFAYYYYVSVIDVTYLDVSNVTNMSHMFDAIANEYGDGKTSIVGIENWNVSNVTNMSYMFGGDMYLLDLSNWNTSNVTDMSYTFANIGSLYGGSTPYITGWDTSSVTNMTGMFAHNQSIIQSNISNFNTSNVTDMSHMFEGFIGLIPDVSPWNVSNVTDMSYMFSGARLSQTADNPLDLSDWDVSQVTNYSGFNSSLDPEGSIILPKFGTTN